MHDLSMFAPKDAKIIRENEGKTAYELLAMGLSEKAFSRLEAGASTDKPEGPTETEAVQPSSIKKTGAANGDKIKVSHSTPAQYRQTSSLPEKVRVLNLRTGAVITTNANYAKRLLKTPKSFKLA